MISAQNSLLKNNALCLQFDGLQEITEFELDASQFSNAGGNLLIHGASDLKQSINALRVQFKSSLKNSIFISLFGRGEQGSYIIVLEIKMFNDWINFSEISGSEWKSFVVNLRLLSYRDLLLLSFLFLLGNLSNLLLLREHNIQIIFKDKVFCGMAD